MNKILITTASLLGLLFTLSAQAADYKIDPAHSFIEFSINHLGMSLLHGRFNDLSGSFVYDSASPNDSRINLDIDPASVDTNHAERDKHLRSKDFLDVKTYPEAKFVSTSYTPGTAGMGLLKGDLTLHGVTKPVEIALQSIGAGDDPWGGYRRGFEGKTTFTMADFGILKNLGPKSGDVEMILSIEGIRQ
jgi:polyisoprenoid-binding protein YceI